MQNYSPPRHKIRPCSVFVTYDRNITSQTWSPYLGNYNYKDTKRSKIMYGITIEQTYRKMFC